MHDAVTAAKAVGTKGAAKTAKVQHRLFKKGCKIWKLVPFCAHPVAMQARANDVSL